MKLAALLVLPSLAAALRLDCDTTMPSGKECTADNNLYTEADPEACSRYYECEDSCAAHQQCQPSEDGLPRVYDEVFEWCEYTDSIDCGSRPCTDEVACATTTERSTQSTTTDCGHQFDCDAAGNGWFADPYNCRKYWHCYKGAGEHYLCPDADDGTPEVFNPSFEGCDFQGNVDCGERPICDECDNNCGTTTSDGPTQGDCGHQMDCTDMEDGWYADEFNCRKYWHCSAGKGQHMMCRDDLQFNPENVQCDFDDRVCCGDRQICDNCDESCVDDDKPDTCEGGGADCGPDSHHPPDQCEGKPDGWYPDKFNCSKYWHCSAEKGTHFLCGTGLVYEYTKVQCDFPDRVKCGDRPICDNCDENCHPDDD